MAMMAMASRANCYKLPEGKCQEFGDIQHGNGFSAELSMMFSVIKKVVFTSIDYIIDKAVVSYNIISDIIYNIIYI